MNSSKSKKKPVKSTASEVKPKATKNLPEPKPVVGNNKKSKRFGKVKPNEDQLVKTQPTAVVSQTVNNLPIPLQPAKKLERSRSFFLTDKLSKIYNKLSGSRENINKINEDSESDGNKQSSFVFTRSHTVSSIQLKKSYRRSIRESTLERLNEEVGSEKDTDKTDAYNERCVDPSPVLESVSVRPDSPPKLVRSNSILTRLMRKLSNAAEKKPEPPNRWSASLQSLQVIDTMVVYDDLSFVNYDKFNTYANNLERTLSQSQRDLSESEMPSGNFSRYGSMARVNSVVETTNPVIRRRDKSNVRRTSKFETDVDLNLDRDKNLYRQSLNSDQLKILSNVTRNSYRWSENFDRLPQDFLCLEEQGRKASVVESNFDDNQEFEQLKFQQKIKYNSDVCVHEKKDSKLFSRGLQVSG